MYTAFREEQKPPEKIKEELELLEYQVFRMQENMKEIAKHWDILGIDQNKEDQWVIVYTQKDEYQCKIMLHDCDKPFRGNWDFSIQAQYTDQGSIFIGDIKGPADRGYGSICMNHLKDIARSENVASIKGDIAKRDWDHVDRLVHFYEKHHFHVEINRNHQSGEIIWNGH